MGKQQKAKFKKFGPPPTLLAVGPKGEIEALPWSKNNNSPVEIRRGKLVLAAWQRDEGWISLADAFAKDSRGPVQMGGLRAYKDWLRARREDRAKKIAGYQHPNKEYRKKFEPYPDHLLPEEALLRRSGRGSNAVESFEPGIPGIEVDPAEVDKAMPLSMQSQTVDQLYGQAVESIETIEIEPDAAEGAPKEGRRRRAKPVSDSPSEGNADS